MEVGSRINIRGLSITVRYVGPHHSKPGTWIGLELDKPKGNINGTTDGHQYFSCAENHGLLVKQEDLEKIVNLNSIDANNDNLRTELNNKLESLSRKSKKVKAMELEFFNEYKKSKLIFEKEIRELNEEFDKKIMTEKIKLENEMVSLEEDIYKTVLSQKQMLEMMNEKKAVEELDMYNTLSHEHQEYEKELELLLKSQNVNINTVTNSISKLKECIKDNSVTQNNKFNEMRKIKLQLDNLEKTLEIKRPKWKDINILREKCEKLSNKNKENENKINYLKLNSISTMELLDLLKDGISIKILLNSERIRNKIGLISENQFNEDILHICDIVTLVFCKKFINKDKLIELLYSFEQLEKSISSNQINNNMLNNLLSLIQAVSPIPINTVLTSHYINKFISKMKNEKTKQRFLLFSKKITKPIHQSILKNEEDAYTSYFTSLTEELNKAINDEEVTYDLFEDLIDIFIEDVYDLNIYQTIVSLQVQKQQKSNEPEHNKKEKIELMEKIQFLQNEISLKQSEYETTKEEINNLLNIEKEIKEKLDIVVSEIDKYKEIYS